MHLGRFGPVLPLSRLQARRVGEKGFTNEFLGNIGSVRVGRVDKVNS